MDTIRQLQLIELDIMQQVLKICQQHNIAYYMLGGTLLGAVRHKGFIPWDDDIDIGLPRPDYERFLEYAQQELKTPYQLHTLFHNSGSYSYYYARVENSQIMLNRKAALKESRIPAWIDVFPLDGVPNDLRKQKRWIRKCMIRKVLFDASQFSYFAASENIKKKRSLPKRIARVLFIHLKLEKLIDTKRAWKMLDKALCENNYESCDRIINFCGYWGIKEMFPKSVYGAGKLYPFENLMLNGPEDYDNVLKQMYGDYMTPPPENAREHHYIELIVDNAKKD